jgi:hypothetical protein
MDDCQFGEFMRLFQASPTPRGEGRGGSGRGGGTVPALTPLRLFPGHSPTVDSVWRAEKGEVLSKILWLP